MRLCTSPPNEVYEYGGNSNSTWRKIFTLQVVFSVVPNTWRVIWDFGSKKSMLKHLSVWGKVFQAIFVLTNCLEPSTVILVPSTPFSRLLFILPLFPHLILFLPFFPYYPITVGTREVDGIYFLLV